MFLSGECVCESVYLCMCMFINHKLARTGAFYNVFETSTMCLNW